MVKLLQPMIELMKEVEKEQMKNLLVVFENKEACCYNEICKEVTFYKKIWATLKHSKYFPGMREQGIGIYM